MGFPFELYDKDIRYRSLVEVAADNQVVMRDVIDEGLKSSRLYVVQNDKIAAEAMHTLGLTVLERNPKKAAIPGVREQIARATCYGYNIGKLLVQECNVDLVKAYVPNVEAMLADRQPFEEAERMALEDASALSVYVAAGAQELTKRLHKYGVIETEQFYPVAGVFAVAASLPVAHMERQADRVVYES